MKLISRDAFKMELYQNGCIDKFGQVAISITQLNIALERSTVDAVEVVRCKDCFYCRKYNEMWRFPKRDVSICIRLYDGDGEEVSAEDYCSWGERREDGKID